LVIFLIFKVWRGIIIELKLGKKLLQHNYLQWRNFLCQYLFSLLLIILCQIMLA
jgi:hypothetical protein